MNKKEWTAYLHEFPCAVCSALIWKEVRPVQTHHVESVRDEYSDFAQAPLCVFHHSELHRLSRRGFERQYKMNDVDLLKHTIRLLAERI